jgi:hypothetical protein
MEIAGVAAAAITFGALILKLSKSLYKSAKKIKYARHDLMKLIKEMGIFADLYEDFYRTCVLEQRRKGRDTSSTGNLIDWIQDATDAFRELSKRVKALAGDLKYSKLETFTAYVWWFFGENEVKYLRSALSVGRENMRVFSNVTVIETINEEMQMIRDVIDQGDRQAIQALEGRFGVTLREHLGELNQMRLVLPIERDTISKANVVQVGIGASKDVLSTRACKKPLKFCNNKASRLVSVPSSPSRNNSSPLLKSRRSVPRRYRNSVEPVQPLLPIQDSNALGQILSKQRVRQVLSCRGFPDTVSQ